jgi:ureidoacrylate peracid hydrolase
MIFPTTRDIPVELPQTTLLFIDVQNYCAGPDGGEFKDMPKSERQQRYGFFFDEMRSRVVPNMQRLQAGCRAAGIEVMYTLIRSLTRDGRDRSLDYKITGFHVPPDSWDGQVIDEIAPAEDEMVIPKTSSNVFVSTNIDYLLRNLGTKYLVISGRAVQRWRMISTESARPQLRHEVKRLERNGIPESTNV